MSLRFDDLHALQTYTDNLKSFFARFGYQLVETPIIQSADLFLTRAGDQVVNRLLTFNRLGEMVALRPEFTTSAAFRYLQMFPDAQPIVRWQFSGEIFEDDPQQPFKKLQQYSVGAELIGMDGAYTDAEMMALAAQGLAQHGIEDWQMRIGNLHLLRLILDTFNLDRRTAQFILTHLEAFGTNGLGKDFVIDQMDQLMSSHDLALDTLPLLDNALEGMDHHYTQQMLNILLDATQRGETMGGRSREEIAQRLLQKRQRVASREQILSALDFLEKWSVIEDMPTHAFSSIEAAIRSSIPTQTAGITDELARWRETFVLLEAMGVREEQLRIMPTLSRNWDYYTGILFELVDSDGTHIGGGGRYNDLIRLLGRERDIPAVGFSYQLDTREDRSETRVDTTVYIGFSRHQAQEALRWAAALREHGIVIALIDNAIETEVCVTVEGHLDIRGTVYHWADNERAAQAITRAINEASR